MAHCELHERVRIDKWLWAARFFKTRALAQAAVVAGKVRLHDERIKPSKDYGRVMCWRYASANSSGT